MKKFTITALVFIIVSLPTFAEAASTLQEKIDAAPNGATIKIEEGEYEGTLIISKPIVIEGKGDVLLRSCNDEPAITIEGNNVTLKNLKVEHCGSTKGSAAIYIAGQNHDIEGIKVKTAAAFGMQVIDAHEVQIKNSEINGLKKAHGMDIWDSNKNHIENIQITNVLDGIYLERSNENLILNNNIKDSRYGIHVMFSYGNILERNVSERNITGAMIMDVDDTSVLFNTFKENNKNVNAQGLLLYRAFNTKVYGNEISSNQLGIFIESSEGNDIRSNNILNNFIGVRFLDSQNNTISENTFIGNVTEAQAIKSSENNLEKNYWDTATLVDINGDGISDIQYTVDPYFLTLVERVPAYKIFFQSPGLILLEHLIESPKEKILIDSAPLMETANVSKKETAKSSILWVMSITMIVISSSAFIVGRKR